MFHGDQISGISWVDGEIFVGSTVLDLFLAISLMQPEVLGQRSLFTGEVTLGSL
jgi:hypothetical protein